MCDLRVMCEMCHPSHPPNTALFLACRVATPENEFHFQTELCGLVQALAPESPFASGLPCPDQAQMRHRELIGLKWGRMSCPGKLLITHQSEDYGVRFDSHIYCTIHSIHRHFIR